MIMQRQHWKEIKAIARAAVAEHKQYGADLYDLVHQMVDGHRWVIYTRNAMEVALWMSDADAWKELGDEFTDELRAYAGMVEDVNAAVSEMGY